MQTLEDLPELIKANEIIALRIFNSNNHKILDIKETSPAIVVRSLEAKKSLLNNYSSVRIKACNTDQLNANFNGCYIWDVQIKENDSPDQQVLSVGGGFANMQNMPAMFQMISAPFYQMMELQRTSMEKMMELQMQIKDKESAQTNVFPPELVSALAFAITGKAKPKASTVAKKPEPTEPTAKSGTELTKKLELQEHLYQLLDNIGEEKVCKILRALNSDGAKAVGHDTIIHLLTQLCAKPEVAEMVVAMHSNTD